MCTIVNMALYHQKVQIGTLARVTARMRSEQDNLLGLGRRLRDRPDRRVKNCSIDHQQPP